MNDARLSRLLVWSGPVFAVLFFVLSFAAGDTPDTDKSAAKVIDYYDDHSNALLASVFLTPLGCALLVTFAAVVRARGRARGDDNIGHTIMMAGAVIWSVGLLVGSWTTLALVDVADDKKQNAVESLNYLASASWLPFIGGIAVFLIGFGIAGIKSPNAPTWFGWLALAIGIISLAGPGGFVGFFGAPLLMFVAGIMMAVRGEQASSPAGTTAPVA